jgi:Tol biopolymer transport system component
MRDDFLKEQLMRYAHSGAEEAVQPGAGEIYRRARRHYQRVAALTVAGMMLIAGLGIGFGLRGRDITPTVNNPVPPATNPGPATPPKSFITFVSGGTGADSSGLAVVSTATGQVIRSLAAAQPNSYTVSQDRKWVYFVSVFPSPGGIYRVPFAGGTAEKVANTTGKFAVSPDGSRLVWSYYQISGGRVGLKVHELATGAERALPLAGGDAAGIPSMLAWSPDSRQVAMVVDRSIKPASDTAGVRKELWIADVATGRWRHHFNFDAKHGGGPDCCQAMAWPAGSHRIVFVVLTVISGGNPDGPLLTYRLVYVEPATGAATPGVTLASGRDLTLTGPDFDASGRYLLFGLQDSHSVSTWWSGGGKPVRVNRQEIGSHAPAEVAGAHVGGEW